MTIPQAIFTPTSGVIRIYAPNQSADKKLPIHKQTAPYLRAYFIACNSLGQAEIQCANHQENLSIEANSRLILSDIKAMQAELNSYGFPIIYFRHNDKICTHTYK